MLQYIVVFLILAASIAYAAVRVYRSLKQADQGCYNACEGCELDKNCKTQNEKQTHGE